MCLYPIYIENKKYKKTKKNGGFIPECEDARQIYVPVGCGVCIECMKQKTSSWRVRLLEEIKTDKTAKFVTLTFSNEKLEELTIKAKERYGEKYKDENEIAATAVRDFLERWRKIHGKSVKHWLIPELGHEGTERLHIHGIIFTNEDIEKRWGNGFVHTGSYVNEKTINYIVKYMTKQDEKHKEFRPKILSSPKIGIGYIKTEAAKKAKRKQETTYKLNNGAEVAMPTYFKNKIFTEKERREIWTKQLNKNETYILGERIKLETMEDWEERKKALEHAQRTNCQMGYMSKNQWEEIKKEKRFGN